MGFYEEMADIGNDLLTEFSQAVAILTPFVVGSGPAYSPGSGVSSPVRHAGVTVRGISQKYIDGKDIIGTDKQAALTVKQFSTEDNSEVIPSVRPTVKDTLTISGIKYRILKDLTVPAEGTPVVYIVAIRKF